VAKFEVTKSELGIGLLVLTKDDSPVYGQRLENKIVAFSVFVLERGADLQPEGVLPLPLLD
jgi:hypothetical protein